jgi:hypothetical protein
MTFHPSIQVIHIGVSCCGVATLLLLHHYYKKEKQEENLREIGKIWIGRIQVGNLNDVLLFVFTLICCLTPN